MDQVVALGDEFIGSGLDVRYLELDRDLGYGNVFGPLAGSEARLGGIGKRPDPQVLRPLESVHGDVVTLDHGKRETQRVFVEGPACRRVGDNG